MACGHIDFCNIYIYTSLHIIMIIVLCLEEIKKHTSMAHDHIDFRQKYTSLNGKSCNTYLQYQ